MIRANKLVKRYGERDHVTTVLNGVSLSVETGEFLFLVGPSGSGKSTLLSILGCVLSPDSGDLEILGTDVSGLSQDQLTRFRRENIGFVFQKFHLFHGLTALENVRVPLDLSGTPPAIARSEAMELLEAVDLGPKSNSKINQLSIGQQQRVAVARALAGNPRIVFADEPTASLDGTSGKQTVELLRDLARDRKAAVIVVTHDTRILGYADRVLHLEDGCLRNEVGERLPALNLLESPSLSDGEVARLS